MDNNIVVWNCQLYTNKAKLKEEWLDAKPFRLTSTNHYTDVLQNCYTCTHNNKAPIVPSVPLDEVYGNS